jgi:hypothetical protein
MLHVFYNPVTDCFKILKYDYEVREFLNTSTYSSGKWKYVELSPDDCIANLMKFSRGEATGDEYSSEEPI